MNRLKLKHLKQVIPAMRKRFGYSNDLAVPKLEKVVINVGISSSKRDEKYLELIEDNLKRITGQKPIFTKAKKSISSFKIRQDQIVGAMVTLRGNRMYDFVDKLISVALPRVRDFRGLLNKSVDLKGNLSIGFREHLAFPEIKADEVEVIHGLEISISTTAKIKEEGLELLKLLGFPFREK